MDNKMSSWKCGTDVAVRFCTQADGTKCQQAGNIHYGESAGGQAASEDTGIHDSLTQIVLMPYDPAVRKAITVFTDTSCHGHSAVLWDDEVYNHTNDQLTLGNDFMSVMLPSGHSWWVDLYHT